MNDYYWGLLIGAAAGYALAVVTLGVIWSLCVIAKRSEDDV